VLISWGDHIKVISIREKERPQNGPVIPQPSGGLGGAIVEGLNTTIGAVGNLPGQVAGVINNIQKFEVAVEEMLEVDSMISGLVGYRVQASSYAEDKRRSLANFQPTCDGFLALCYPSKEEEITGERALGRMPELKIINAEGEELTSDELSLKGFEKWGCKDYKLASSCPNYHSLTLDKGKEEIFYVLSPTDIVLVRRRDRSDHIDWLLEHERYEEALKNINDHKLAIGLGGKFDIKEIGVRWLHWLTDHGIYTYNLIVCFD
jgi:vacuolar protein sorting-associated protein 41